MATGSVKSVDVKAERLKDLLKDLIDIYSPSGKEEEILEYIEGYMKNHGLPLIKQQVDENRFNLVVLPGKEEEVDLCFVGHLDTVVAHDLEDYGYNEDGDTISGLGAADMKSGCAAMIEAFTALAEAKRSLPSVGLALVVGEEEESDGAKTLVREYSFPWAVVGEPTSMVPCLGHYGYLEVLLRTRGKKAHSSMPELGQNAIETMLKLLLKVTEYFGTVTKDVVYNIRQLSGFPGGFVVPDTCEAWLDLHLHPDSRVDMLKAELEQLVEAADETSGELDSYIRFENTQSGYRISPRRPLVKRLREVYKKLSLPWEPQDFRSHSDGNVLWAAGVDPIILGPGSLETAHTSEEAVNFSQVMQAAQLYVNFALSINSPFSK